MHQYKKPYLPKASTGTGSKTTCPECGQKKTFRLYFDGNSGKPINSKVGICDRLIKCGYHYPPKQYFQEHPEKTERKNDNQHRQPLTKYHNSPKPSEPHDTIPFSYVEKSASYQSNFVRFLCEIMTEEQIRWIGDEYALGATKNKEVIFWQIDTKGKVRTGKIMQYNPETGKRIKHQTGAINWVHNELKKSKELPEDYNLKQCFFGEHLLKIYPDKTIGIVESEKSACIASVLFPDLVWLSAGNIHGISVEKCKILKGGNVILFPDLKANEIWSAKAVEISKHCKCNIKVSFLLEEIATDTEKDKGLDIADYLIETLKNKKYKSLQPNPTPVPQPTHQNKYSQTLNKFIETNPNIELLIEKLSLEEVS